VVPRLPTATYNTSCCGWLF